MILSTREKVYNSIDSASSGQSEGPISKSTHYSYEEIIWTTSGKTVSMGDLRQTLLGFVSLPLLWPEVFVPPAVSHLEDASPKNNRLSTCYNLAYVGH